jgi:hypothetical protein
MLQAVSTGTLRAVLPMTMASSTSQSKALVPIGMCTVAPAADHRVARRLHEEEQALVFLLGAGHAHLGQVVEVVGAGAQDLAGVQQRRQHLQAVRRQGMARRALGAQGMQVVQAAGPVGEQAGNGGGQAGTVGRRASVVRG